MCVRKYICNWRLHVNLYKIFIDSTMHVYVFQSVKYKLKQHKPWFDAKYSHFLDQKKQAKMQCLQYPNHNNVDNLNNVKHQTSRNFRNKKKEYLKAKIDELEINNKKRRETSTGATNILRMVTSLELI